MSVCTARVAGVPNIVATSPAHKEAGVNPAILYAMQLCGAHTVLALGGVQAIAALAYGLYAKAPADIIVGPGNRFVAEAKRTLFGSIGIDVVAGPTESAIIADESADAKSWPPIWPARRSTGRTRRCGCTPPRARSASR